MRRAWHYPSLVWLTLALACAARAADRDGDRQPRQVPLALGSPVELAAAGLRLTPFRGLRLMPLPTTQRLTDKEGRELFPPLGLWIRGQYVAHFGGPHATLTVAIVRFSPSLGILRQPLVTSADFQQACEADSAAPWDEARLGAWVAAAAAPVAEKSASVKGLHLGVPYQRFLHQRLDAAQAQTFLLDAPDGRRFAFLFRLASGYPAAAVDDTIGRVLKSAKFFPPEREDGPASRFQEHRAGPERVARSAAYEQARAEVIDSIGNLPGWWYVETANYVIKSNMTSSDRTLIRDIQTDLEIMRRAYEVFLPPPQEFTAVGVVTVPDTRAEYLGYVGPGLEWSAGVWMPTRKELVISPLDWGGRNRRLGLALTLHTVYHEAFHQYLHYALPNVVTPVWFNEGHAMLFEAAAINRQRREIEVGENEERLAIVLDRVKAGTCNLAALRALDYPAFYSGDAAGHYGLAWGLVYFLRKAGHLYPARPYAEVCARLQASLARQPDWRQANADAFTDIADAQLERDFVDFWKDSGRRAKARRFELLTDAQYRARQAQEAAEKLAAKNASPKPKDAAPPKPKDAAPPKPKDAAPPKPGDPAALKPKDAASATAKDAAPPAAGPPPATAFDTAAGPTPETLKPILVATVQWLGAQHQADAALVATANAQLQREHCVLVLEVVPAFAQRPAAFRQAFAAQILDQWQAACVKERRAADADHAVLLLVDAGRTLVGGYRNAAGARVWLGPAPQP